MEKREQILSDPATHALYQTMLRYLSKGDASKERLRDRIKRLQLRYPKTIRYQGYTPERVEMIIKILEDDDLINETRYAERVFESLRDKYNGMRLIRQKMLARKIDSTVVNNTIKSFEATGQGQDLQRIIVRAEKKYETLLLKRKGERGASTRARQDLYQWLSLRGYGSDEIQSILEVLREDREHDS